MSNQNLNVAYVVPGWPLNAYPNGIVSYTNNLIQGFGQSINPVLLAYNTDKSTHQNVIDLSDIHIKHNLGSKLFNTIVNNTVFAYTQKLRYQQTYAHLSQKIAIGLKNLSTSPDVIELEETFGLARWLAQSTNIPIITRLHGPWLIQAPVLNLTKAWDYQFRTLNEGLGIHASQGITAPSQNVLASVREFYQTELANAVVIPNSVPEVAPEYRWQGLELGSKSILFVGRFDLTKGGDLVVDAFNLIAQKDKTVKLVFVGPNSGIMVHSKKLKFQEYIDTTISEAHIKARIEFLGHCDEQTVKALRRAALITIVASRYENFSLSLLEALSTGCPVVATAVGGNKEIIQDHYNGLLAEPDSAESIADRVLNLIENKTLLLSLSENAVIDCEKKYKPEIVAKQTVDYYKAILEKSSK